jgi:DMSO/TMAO reductase YedYZ molybdopterin-dependent catalytic subunit
MSRLRIEVGNVRRELDPMELERLPRVAYEDAVGVPIAALLDALGVVGTHVTFRSADGYATTLARATLGASLLLYRLADGALPRRRGGPFRLIAQGHIEGTRAHLKFVESIVLSFDQSADVLPHCDHAARHSAA